MKEVELTQGHVALVDDEDCERVNQFLWQIKRCRNTVYASGYVGERGNKKRITMHRFIMNLHLGDIRKIDHINHNGLNNQKSNLRICSQFENMKNRVSRHGSSQYKGVHWHKRDRKWYAQIKSDAKRIHLGGFDSEHDAALAYNDAAIKYHSEYAKLNIITGRIL